MVWLQELFLYPNWYFCILCGKIAVLRRQYYMAALQIKKQNKEYSIIQSYLRQVNFWGRTFGWLLLSLWWVHQARGQASIADSAIQLVTLDVRYQGALPQGPINERWGYISQFGMDIGVKGKSNFFASVGTYALFTQFVNTEGVLDPLLSSGFITTDDGVVSEPRVLGTGLVVPLRIGKIFPVGPRPNDNSGWVISLGGQFLRYRFDFRSSDGEVAGLEGDYEKGYDHLVSGYGLNQSLGYRLFNNRGDVNFMLGLEFSQNFTRHRRPVHFATGPTSDELRTDLLWGFFAAWTFPLYERAPNRVYYY